MCPLFTKNINTNWRVVKRCYLYHTNVPYLLNLQPNTNSYIPLSPCLSRFCWQGEGENNIIKNIVVNFIIDSYSCNLFSILRKI